MQLVPQLPSPSASRRPPSVQLAQIPYSMNWKPAAEPKTFQGRRELAQQRIGLDVATPHQLHRLPPLMPFRHPKTRSALRLAKVRVRSRNYWRCLEELAATHPSSETCLEREFPVRRRRNGPRRTRLATGCRRGTSWACSAGALAGARGHHRLQSAFTPDNVIVPYVKQPEQIMVPGKPLYYATAMPLQRLRPRHPGKDRDAVVPIKIEGNPKHHPDSLGATDAITQAAVLSLVGPRPLPQRPTFQRGEISTLEQAFESELLAVLKTMRCRCAGSGNGRILAEADSLRRPSPGSWARRGLGNFPRQPVAHLDALKPGPRVGQGHAR